MNRPPLTVTDARLDEEADGTLTLGGAVDGHRLFWTMPARPEIALRGEPFIAALLVSAMSTGRDLMLPDTLPADPAFLTALDELQGIFVRWFPGLQRVRVFATAAPRLHVSGRMTGYSAGVDSSYTVLRLHERLDAVVLMDGIEFGDPVAGLVSEVDATLRGVMARRGLPMHVVRTNVKGIGKKLGGKWAQFIGGSLASVPHALGVAEYWIASSNAWEKLRPYGSHPITDPRWSSTSTIIAHHGCELDRYEKIAALAGSEDLLDVLRVCFQGTAYNCGLCHKCLKTSAALRALDLTSASLPALAQPRLLRTLSVDHDDDYLEWQELLTPALSRRDPVLEKELRRLTGRYALRQTARRLDEVATGGLFRTLLKGRGVR